MADLSWISDELAGLLARYRQEPARLAALLRDPWADKRVDHTVDVVLFTIRAGRLYVLLVERKGTFGGFWALPGGFVGLREHFVQAAFRELFEEVLGLPADATLAELGRRAAELGLHMEQLGTYDDPARDPRRRTITTAFVALLPERRVDTVSGSDVVRADWWPVDALPRPAAVREAELWAPVSPGARVPPGAELRRGADGVLWRRRTLAFDHDLILGDARERVASKAEYTLLAFHLVGETFTMKQLAQVYEVLWGEPIVDKPGGLANFRRLMDSLNKRMRETQGLYVFERTGERVGLAHTGRKAEVYRKLWVGSPGMVTKGKDVETRGRKGEG